MAVGVRVAHPNLRCSAQQHPYGRSPALRAKGVTEVAGSPTEWAPTGETGYGVWGMGSGGGPGGGAPRHSNTHTVGARSSGRRGDRGGGFAHGVGSYGGDRVWGMGYGVRGRAGWRRPSAQQHPYGRSPALRAKGVTEVAGSPTEWAPAGAERRKAHPARAGGPAAGCASTGRQRVWRRSFSIMRRRAAASISSAWALA
jgi:hypothetical protein